MESEEEIREDLTKIIFYGMPVPKTEKEEKPYWLMARKIAEEIVEKFVVRPKENWKKDIRPSFEPRKDKDC